MPSRTDGPPTARALVPHPYRRQYAGIVLGLLALGLVSFVLPAPPGMQPQAMRILGVILCLLCLWMFDSFPIGVSSAFALVLMPLVNVMPLDAALEQFMRPATFFVVTTYALTCAFSKTPLARRLLRRVLRLAGHSTPRVILALMATTCLLSTIISNVPVTAMMMTVALEILGAMGAKPGQSSLGRTVMLAIPIAAVAGGYMTPAGSSNNVMAVNLLTAATGQNITFLQWMMVGVPLGLVLLPLSWLYLVRFFKPGPIPAKVMEDFTTKADLPDKITPREWRALAIILGTVALWIIGSQTMLFDMTFVATVSMLAFFFPGVNVFTWEEFQSAVSWDAVFTVGSIMALGAGVLRTGLGVWIVDGLLAGTSAWPVLVLLLFIALAVNFFHLILPVSPAIISIVLPAMLALCRTRGLDPASVTLLVPMMAGCVMLLPIDTMTILTYSKKYYTIDDMFRSGLGLSCVWAVLIALWVYACVVLL